MSSEVGWTIAIWLPELNMSFNGLLWQQLFKCPNFTLLETQRYINTCVTCCQYSTVPVWAPPLTEAANEDRKISTFTQVF